ncbi:MAG: UDP-glucose 4-epimerase GalE [Gammaproteobacteria bacterium]|nr:UDP-glucose 4-epimerase GalE [Gammaproteobacteria bacterium]
MKIMVAGGAGYIGSHTCVELLQKGYDVVVVDNLSNSSLLALDRVQKITEKNLDFYEIDIRDRLGLDKVFAEHKIDAVIHFAGLKAVGESVEMPLEYYNNNLYSTIVLCQAMQAANVKTILFSSSATVYGDPHEVPIKEDFPLSATNPYGRSKLIVEEILADLYVSDNEWKVGLLRYFNPVGAHPSGTIGEDPNGIPNNLMPYISQVAVGKLKQLQVFGDDYSTHDGTGVRDYIHVVDLARGHIAMIEYQLSDRMTGGVSIVNLGTGRGYSVLDMIDAYKRASRKDIPFAMVARRAGDIAECYADPAYALQLLGWKAEFDLDQMCEDSWHWQSKNPNGYQ